jgi:metal-responsive CopG/Arc/MetJ family transcriptional regulator
MAEERKFVNIPMEPDLVEKLDELVEDHGSTRAQLIRLLVKQRYEEFTHLKIVKQQFVTKVNKVAKS